MSLPSEPPGLKPDGDEIPISPIPRMPRLTRTLMGSEVTARTAVRTIATVTIVIAIACGILMRVFDKEDFSTIGDGLWFSLQTVTTVGYGDVVPHNTQGRLLGALIMLAGIGFIAVITAAVTASLVESARRKPRQANEARVEQHLEDILARLAAIETQLSRKE